MPKTKDLHWSPQLESEWYPLVPERLLTNCQPVPRDCPELYFRLWSQRRWHRTLLQWLSCSTVRQHSWAPCGQESQQVLFFGPYPWWCPGVCGLNFEVDIHGYILPALMPGNAKMSRQTAYSRKTSYRLPICIGWWPRSLHLDAGPYLKSWLGQQHDNIHKAIVVKKGSESFLVEPYLGWYPKVCGVLSVRWIWMPL